MNARAKDVFRAGGARKKLLKGRVESATPARLKVTGAKRRVPKGRSSDAPVTAIKGARAIACAPKGHDRPVRAPELKSGGAAYKPPAKASRTAPRRTSSKAGRAIIATPAKAEGAAPALSLVPDAGGANLPLLKGQKRGAPQHHLSIEDGAKTMAPKGQAAGAPSSPPTFADTGHAYSAERPDGVLPCPQISTLRELHRQRQDFHRAEKSLTLQVRAICRRLCAGDKDEADKLYSAIGKADDQQAEMVKVLVEPFFQARAILESNRKRVEKDMERTAKMLPIVEWVNGIKGLGIGSLAALVGEAGDIGSYQSHSHLWKRMGLAVIGGERQRRVAGADAIEHGYSPSRRSIMWNVGQCVFKAQSQRVDKETGEVKSEAGFYRKVYDARKEYELPRVESKGHAHNRAMRYMEKKLLRDLYNAWRAM